MYIRLTIIFVVHSCIGYNYDKKLPDLYINYFKQNKEVHNYDTKNRNKLHVSYKRTDNRKYCILFLAREILYGIVLMKLLEILNHSFPLIVRLLSGKNW